VVERWIDLRLAELGLAKHLVRIECFHGPFSKAWLHAERVITAQRQNGARELVVLAAAHCDLDEALLVQWEAAGRLFAAQRQPKGLMPGEGAAWVLLADEQWPWPAEVDDTPVRVHRAALAVRDKSIEAPGRVSSQVLESAVDAVLSATQLPAEQVLGLVSDSEQHGPRNGELFGAVMARFPHLDAVEDVRLLGAGCGHLGAVGALAAVALAARQSSQIDAPVMALSLGDPLERLAWLARKPQAST